MKKLLQTFTFTLGLAISQIATAIDWSAYSHDGDIGYRNSTWMAQLPNDRPISQISMVGTHDTMSLYGGDSVQTSIDVVEYATAIGYSCLRYSLSTLLQ